MLVQGSPTSKNALHFASKNGATKQKNAESSS
jgi:hypothetical protein